MLAQAGRIKSYSMYSPQPTRGSMMGEAYSSSQYDPIVRPKHHLGTVIPQCKPRSRHHRYQQYDDDHAGDDARLLRLVHISRGLFRYRYPPPAGIRTEEPNRSKDAPDDKKVIFVIGRVAQYGGAVAAHGGNPSSQLLSSRLLNSRLLTSRLFGGGCQGGNKAGKMDLSGATTSSIFIVGRVAQR